MQMCNRLLTYMTTLNWKLIAEIAGGVLFVALLVWFFFIRQTTTLEPAETAPQQTFGQSDTRTSTGAQPTTDGTNVAEAIPSPVSKQKVFKMSDGPVAGAAFMQELRPTTTIARFVMQRNGHVLDLAIDSPGSVARAASNTTIPGVSRVIWELQNSAARQVAAGAALQYLDSMTVKTVLMTFPQATTTTPAVQAPVRIQFLPDNLVSVASSPDGLSLAYLVKTALGADGYVARADGSNPRKLFSLPLSQLILTWPSAQTMLATTPSAAGVAGIAFSVDATSGATAPILYAAGLSTNADRTFGKVVYQSANNTARTTYVHDTKTNLDRPLSFDPMPEKCAWSRTEAMYMYCAVPLSYVPPTYNDLWHQGSGSAADSIVAYDLLTGQTTVVATPGGTDGGEVSDIAELAVSPDNRYVLFVKKGDRSLWGVRL
jgi:hypothetical protein